jgi:uncharacterized integral membrane protein (TIGR00698 family)
VTVATPSAAPAVAPAGGPSRPAIGPGLTLLVALAAVATVLSAVVPVLSPLVAGVVLGAAVVNLVALPERFQPGITFGARSLLRFGVVLLGFRLSVGDVVGLGTGGLLVVAMVVTTTFLGTRWLARRLGVPEDLGLLVATGYSICGASAIAAMDGVVRADEEETAYAITLVTLCGTLSIFVLPLLADPLGMAGETFGTWVGGAVHDVGQVVATASTQDADAVAAATVVKLTRVVLLAPLVATIAIGRRRAVTGSDDDPTRRPPLLPLFVIGFLAAIAVRSTGWLSAGTLDHVATMEELVLTVALVGLGAGVRVARMRRLSGRPLLLGGIAWALVAGASLVGTALVS